MEGGLVGGGYGVWWFTFTRRRLQVSQPLYFPGTPTMLAACDWVLGVFRGVDSGTGEEDVAEGL